MKSLRILLLAIVVMLSACAPGTPMAPAETGGNAEVVVPTVEAEETFGPLPTEVVVGNGAVGGSVHNELQLKNIEYTIASLDNKKIQLTDGVYENADEHIFVSYLETKAYADLEGDGSEEAIVLLGANFGASGMFTDLAIVSSVDGLVTNTATVMLGDRVDVRDLTVEDGTIVVRMITQGPNEPMCCGTLEVEATYALEDGALVETGREDIGYLQGVENFYNPDTFANMTVATSVIPSGTVTLTDGEYENVADRVIATLDTRFIQFSDLNEDGKDEAVLLLHANTGGSGMFTEMFVAGGTDGELVTLATTLLGDRVTVYNIVINEKQQIVVDMLTQGVDDPMCCPTSHVEAIYALNGETLEEVSVTEIGTIPAQGSSGLTPDSVTIDISGIADSIEGTLVPYQPIMEGPGMTGTPEHLLYSFNGEVVESYYPSYTQLRVFPVEQFVAMHEESPLTISAYINALREKLEGKSTELPDEMDAPMLFLPVFNAGQDLAANVKYVDFDGGQGFRFIFHYGQAVDAFLSGQIFYGYQGLTDDGNYLVLYMTPLQTDLLPETYDEIPQEVLDGIWDGSTYSDYRSEVIATLNAATSDDFTPTLDALDGMMESLTISAE